VGSSTVEITLEPQAGGWRCWSAACRTGGGSRDPTAAVDGAGPLADHIGMVQQLVGGTRLELRGAPESCHGVVRFAWAALGPGEAVLATGTNVAGTDLDGRFRWVTGFWDPPVGRPEPPQRP
jgi:hypothetical protein